MVTSQETDIESKSEDVKGHVEGQALGTEISDWIQPYLILHTEYQHTPPEAGLGAHTGETTRESVDYFIKKDLNTHTVRNISFEAFLESILKFKVEYRKPRLSSFDLPKYDDYLSAYTEKEKQLEPERYSPFSVWVNFIITEAEKRFPELQDA
jgi:hypothetical protein